MPKKIDRKAFKNWISVKTNTIIQSKIKASQLENKKYSKIYNQKLLDFYL